MKWEYFGRCFMKDFIPKNSAPPLECVVKEVSLSHAMNLSSTAVKCQELQAAFCNT
jgi:hypothetical protein